MIVYNRVVGESEPNHHRARNEMHYQMKKKEGKWRRHEPKVPNDQEKRV